MGRTSEAEAVLSPISREMPIIENPPYQRLMLMYKGMLPPDSLALAGAGALTDATTGYGLGNWHLYNGQREEVLRGFPASGQRRELGTVRLYRR